MQRERHLWGSAALGHDMECLEYGHSGRPLLAFPSINGRAWDFDGFGMAEACAALIEAGRLRLYAVDSIDWQSWTNQSATAADRARRHSDYDRYIKDELVPFVRARTGWETIWATGCSMGAFHASSVFFRHPDAFDGLIAISGLYQPRMFVGDYCDDEVYFATPLYFLPKLDDPWYLERYRRSRIVFAVGQGAWEDECLVDTRQMQQVLAAKGIPAWFDYWGHDVDHDWPWWRRMLPYFLERLGV